MKDYTAIVLQGIADPANRKNMEAFYISECKKAERDEFIIPELFFDSCIAKIEIFKEYYERKKFEELHNLNEALVALRQGRFKHSDEDLKNKTIEQCDHEEEQIILNRINDVRKNFIHQIQFPAFTFHKAFTGHLSYSDVLEMEAAIVAAKMKAGMNPATSSKQKNLTFKQIALIHYYNNMPITRKNEVEIAKKYGHTGAGLYNKYTFYFKKCNRLATPNSETETAIKNKIELFESVISHIKDTSIITDEIDTLKSHLLNSD